MSLLHLELEHGSIDGPCIGTTCLDLIDGSNPYILKLHSHYVDILNIDGSTTYRFKTSNAIVAYDKIKPPGLTTDWLLILTELNTFYIVSFAHKQQKFSHQIVQSFDLKEHQVPKISGIDSDNRLKNIVSQKCFIVADSKSGRFIIVHSFKGFLLIFELKPSKSTLFSIAAQNKVHPDVKRNPKLAVLDKYQIIEQPVSLYIGDNILTSLHIMQTDDPSKWWVCTITKSFNLEYSMDFYLLFKPKNIQLKLKYTVPLDDFPDLIIPFFGFVMLFFPTKHIIYPLPEIDLISENTNSSIVFLNNHLINEIGIDGGHHKRFQTYAFKNDRELILITSNSEFYKLQINHAFESGLKQNKLAKRTRSQMEEPENSILRILQWDIKNLNHRSENTYVFNLTIIDDIYWTLNRHSQLLKIRLNDEIIEENVKNLENTMALPITNINIQKGMSFTSTDTHVSCVSSDLNYHIEKNSTVNGCIEVGSFSVRYLEYSPENNANSSLVERIEVHQSGDETLSAFDFDEFVNITCLVPMKELKPFLTDMNDFLDSEVFQWENMLLHSFLALTTSSNEADYDREEDLYMRRRTELFLFVINEEGVLELKAIAVLKCRIQSALQLDQRNILLLGDGVSIRLGITLFRDIDGDKKVHAKLSKHSEKLLQVSGITITRKLKDNMLLLVDPYTGVYIGKLEDGYQLKSKQRLLFPWKLITCLQAFSEDMIILGDLLGNIVMLDMVYDDKDIPNSRIFCCFNPNLGGIGCITCHFPTMNESDGVKICSVGTASGAIITLSLYQSNCEGFLKLLNKSKKQILKERLDLEHNTVKLDQIEKTFDSIQLFEWLINASHSLKCFFTKMTPITELNTMAYEDENKESPLILFDDTL